jgi:hypothetical protein
LFYLVDVKLSAVVEHKCMHEDQVNGVKKPLRALGPATVAAGRKNDRNVPDYLTFWESSHLASSACNVCWMSRAIAWSLEYDATTTHFSRRKSS